jgi:hypothetical protein
MAPDSGSIRPPVHAKGPGAPADRLAIREQLERVLNSPLFCQSKRYPQVLRYLVDRVLEGSQEGELKERTIGVEVLGREPNYDTNADPTVRVVAGEIRKRLILYYQEPAHASELRIELPAGSYTPEFPVPAPAPPPDPGVSKSPARPRHTRVWLASGAVLCAALIGLASYWLMPRQAPIDQFWEPVFRGSQNVVVCLAGRRVWGAEDRMTQPAPAPPASAPDAGSADNMRQYLTNQPTIPFRDVESLTNLVGFLQAHGLRTPLRVAGTTSLEDLQQGPAILIGAYNNYWTLHLGADLRFRFATNDKEEMGWIEDRENPASRDWSLNLLAPYSQVREDYAVVSRVADPSTGHILVFVAGISGLSTKAASAFLVSPAAWQDVARQAPRDWMKKNIQIVIGMKVVNGNPGPATVLKIHTW